MGVTLARKRDSSRHSTAGFSENDFSCRHHMTRPEIKFSHAAFRGGRRHRTTNLLTLSKLACGP